MTKHDAPIPLAVRQILQEEKYRSLLLSNYANCPDAIDVSNWWWAKAILCHRQSRKSAGETSVKARTPIENGAVFRQTEKKQKQILKLLKDCQVKDVNLQNQHGCDGSTIMVHHSWIKTIYDKGLGIIPQKEDKIITLSITRPLLGFQVEVYGATVAVPHTKYFRTKFEKEEGFIAKFEDKVAYGSTIRTALQRLRATYKQENQLVYETARLLIK